MMTIEAAITAMMDARSALVVLLPPAQETSEMSPRG
jgi:hypothetical protein